MENEIKVNEFVRTKDGVIDKVIIDYKGKCNNLNCNRKHISCEKNYYNEDEIIKHSPNLIDIIEERRLCKWKKNRCYYRWFFKTRRYWRESALFRNGFSNRERIKSLS